MPIPATATIAPKTSFKVSFSFKMMCEGKSIKTGTVAISVEAIPNVVNLKATIPSDTPRNGPKKEPMSKAFDAFLSFTPL